MGYEKIKFDYSEETNSYKRKNEQAIPNMEKAKRAILAVGVLLGGYIYSFMQNEANDEKAKLKIPAIEQAQEPAEAKVLPQKPFEKTVMPKEKINKNIKSFTEVVNFDAEKIIIDKANCDALTNYWHKIYKEHPDYREKLEAAYVKMAPWRKEFEKIFESYGVPKEYIFLAIVESDFENKISDKGAAGYFQIIKANAGNFGLKKIADKWDERNDPKKSCEVTAKMLKENFEGTKTKNNPDGDRTVALEIYNGLNKKSADALKSQGLERNIDNYRRFFLEKEMNRIKKEIMENNAIPHDAKRKEFYKQISNPEFDLMQNFQYAIKIEAVIRRVKELDSSGKYDIKPYAFSEEMIRQPKDIIYTTVKGDSLGKIAAKFGVGREAIIRNNPSLTAPESNTKLAGKKERKKKAMNYILVRENQLLKIPNPQKPLTLKTLAERKKIDQRKLAELNPMFDLNDPLPDYKIRIPKG